MKSFAQKLFGKDVRYKFRPFAFCCDTPLPACMLQNLAAPIQGILRGYKDVNAPFYSSLIAYWVICMPLGLFLDYRLGHGPYSYWQSLDIGLFFSALILLLRLKYVRKEMREEK